MTKIPNLQLWGQKKKCLCWDSAPKCFPIAHKVSQTVTSVTSMPSSNANLLCTVIWKEINWSMSVYLGCHIQHQFNPCTLENFTLGLYFYGTISTSLENTTTKLQSLPSLSIWSINFYIPDHLGFRFFYCLSIDHDLYTLLCLKKHIH